MYSHSDTKKPNIFIIILILFLSIGFIFFKINNYNNKNIQNNSEFLIYEGKILDIINEEKAQNDNGEIIYTQDLNVEIKYNDQLIVKRVFNDFIPLEKNDKIFLQEFTYNDEQNFTLINTYKTNGIIYLTIIFSLLLILITGYKGIYSLIGLIFSLAIIIGFIIPSIYNGMNPILISLIGAIVILMGVIYISEGLSKKSISAFLGIIITLIFVSITANYVIHHLNFSGINSEETMYLSLESDQKINLIGLIIGGIIIAAIGILDDIAITQASIVHSLALKNPSIKSMDLFKEAMIIGKDHISAVINTLVLAYTGAELSLFLLFSIRSFSVSYILSMDVMAEEIVRTLISTAGLILVAPITTLVMILFIKENNNKYNI
ncbi:MAG: hypothetical protein UR28_C0008G0006 [Candidatus Peregrinibacteria bacterium GW2011_GWF2_33_10]|nr:MAG: hypothetical protein UR28_C0008G0006 [Candidatus Peregrinibacteria bacterium GW2011_GWF2_33_10]OGJ45209.1 MAG: hypothetical protein A2263_06580 [Candidatus Peregrinibacteria bacterium RIFOXYA2_FULL_33_21]OGJ46461.1 MAG: hypothetical protein A2272_00270 [Candidatus Peregrinibacteria bacterium RIFOXYA12_FULL_33_12]OGJ51133.1 MAG: hypothetical protein A2307_04665 [Candidatus Peregrinibacteria bacterium RIFOXYB2_FULL_33_20]